MFAGGGVQGSSAISIGNQAGASSQGAQGVAIGVEAGGVTQGSNAIAMGHRSGYTSQGSKSVAIGRYAGTTSQGANSIAIGANAGYTSQGANSIILNATGANLNQTTANTFTVAPVRNDVANVGNVMFYNTTSNEITYGNIISVAGNITGANISVSAGGFMKLSSYTAAALTAITGQVGWMAAVTNSASGGNPNGMIAFWDTTNTRWSYIHDNGAV